MPITTPWTTLDYSSSGLRWGAGSGFPPPPGNEGSIGSGTLTVTYKRALGITFFRLVLVYGATTVNPVGVSFWKFELPADVLPNYGGTESSSCGIARSAQSVVRPGQAVFLRDTASSGIPSLAATYIDGDGLEQLVTSTAPATWVTGDKLLLTGWFDSLDN